MNLDTFKNGWVLGSFHCGEGLFSVDCCKITKDDFSLMKDEVLSLVSASEASSVSDKKHPTNWVKPKGQARQFSCYNTSGRFDDSSSDHDENISSKSSSHLVKLPVLKAFIDSIPNLINFRINVLGENGGGLNPHEEHIFIKGNYLNLSNEIRVRFHIPFKTNEAAKMYVGTKCYHYSEGMMYMFNNGAVHSAVNDGNTIRVHAVFDVKYSKKEFADWLKLSYFQDVNIEKSKEIGGFNYKYFQSYGRLNKIFDILPSDFLKSKIYTSLNFIRKLLFKVGLVKVND